jgi:hypothetical protein
MQIIPEVEFRSWLAAGGIVPHPRWGNSDTLACTSAEDLSRFWFPSFVPSDLPGFVETALSAASSVGPYYLLRRGGGSWYESDPETAPGANLVIDTLLRAAGVPAHATGAIRFEKTEWLPLSLIIIAHYVHGWSVGEDLHIIAEERDCALKTSHHGELAAHFPNEARLERFRQAMLEEGYDLPSDLPDESFKSPAWLKGRVRRGTA